MKKTRALWGTMLIALLVMGTGCQGRKGTIITLAGSTAFLPVAEELANAYMNAHPGMRINVQGGGSVVGIQSVKEGAANIGMADMVELPSDVTASMKVVTVARDGIAIIVHPSNKEEGLTLARVKDIFSGKITDWKEVKGTPGEINVISREEGSGTRKSFEQLVLKDEAITQKAMFQDSNGTVRESVASNPNAVSYISIGFVDKSVKVLKLDGCEPTNANVKANKYPLVRPIYFLTKSQPEGLAGDFIAYVLSPDGQKLIEEKGLIPIQ